MAHSPLSADSEALGAGGLAEVGGSHMECGSDCVCTFHYEDGEAVFLVLSLAASM